MQHFTIAWRFLLGRPTATTIAVVTLAIAVAIGTIAVGTINQAFWRPSRAERGSDLVTIYNSRPTAPFYQTLSFPDHHGAGVSRSCVAVRLLDTAREGTGGVRFGNPDETRRADPPDDRPSHFRSRWPTV